MTKDELIAYIAGRQGWTKSLAEQALNATIEGITVGLQVTGRVQLRHFGAFEVKQRPQWLRRNPQNMAPVIVPPTRRVAFRAGKTLSAQLNGEQQ